MVRGTINQHQEVIKVISINFQAKTARVQCGSGVGFDNYQRSGVGPGLIWIIAKGPGYLDVRQVMYVNF